MENLKIAQFSSIKFYQFSFPKEDICNGQLSNVRKSWSVFGDDLIYKCRPFRICDDIFDITNLKPSFNKILSQGLVGVEKSNLSTKLISNTLFSSFECRNSKKLDYLIRTFVFKIFVTKVDYKWFKLYSKENVFRLGSDNVLKA